MQRVKKINYNIVFRCWYDFCFAKRNNIICVLSAEEKDKSLSIHNFNVGLLQER